MRGWEEDNIDPNGGGGRFSRVAYETNLSPLFTLAFLVFNDSQSGICRDDDSHIIFTTRIYLSSYQL